jgi:hypothetical protein
MDNDILSQRLDRLQRQLSIWRGLVIILIVLFGVALASHLGAAPTRIDATAVVAHEFDLVNASGTVTARLAADPKLPDFPELVLEYPNHQPAIHLSVNSPTFASISVLNKDGAPRAILSEHSVDPYGGGPSLSLFDEDAKLRIVMDGGGSTTQFAVYDKNRKRIWVAPTN